MPPACPPASADIAIFKSRWGEVCQALALPPFVFSTAVAWGRTLAARYSEPHRHYHTVRHVAEMLTVLEDLWPRDLPQEDRTIGLLATFFHDAVYDGTSRTNEEDSIVLFGQFVQDMSGCVSEHVATRVAHLIDATKSHHHVEGDDQLAMFLDADMSILGKPWERYQEYTRQVRMEYRHVPWAGYIKGRGAVLRSFLASPSLYGHPGAVDRFQGPALSNMGREVAWLEDPSTTDPVLTQAATFP